MIVDGRLVPARIQRIVLVRVKQCSKKIKGLERLRPLFNSHKYSTRRRTVLMTQRWIALASSSRQTFKHRRWYQYHLRNENISYPNFLEITWLGRSCARLEHADRRYQKQDTAHERFARWHSRRREVARRSCINAIEERLTGQRVRLQLSKAEFGRFMKNLNTRYSDSEGYSNYLNIEFISWLSERTGRIIERDGKTLYGEHWLAALDLDTIDSDYVFYDVRFSDQVEPSIVLSFILTFS